MSAEQEGEDALRQPSGSLAPSESAALGLQPEDDDYDNAVPSLESPSSPPPNHDPPTRRVRSEYEFQVEKNKRQDEVEPTLAIFRDQRLLHTRQLEDFKKKSAMVTERIDKLDKDIEKLRQQWGELEREKAKVLEAQQLWEQKKAALAKVVHKDDVIAQKYLDYVQLNEEVLVLDDSEDEDGDDMMYDWPAQGQGGGKDEQQQEQEDEE